MKTTTMIRRKELAMPERLEAVTTLLRLKEWLVEAAEAQKNRIHLLMSFLSKAEAALYYSQQWDDVIAGRRTLTPEEAAELRLTIDAMNRHLVNSLDFVRRVAATIDLEKTSTTEEVERLAWLIAGLDAEDRKRLMEAVRMVKAKQLVSQGPSASGSYH